MFIRQLTWVVLCHPIVHGQMSCTWCLKMVPTHFYGAWVSMSPRSESVKVESIFRFSLMSSFHACLHIGALSPAVLTATLVTTCQTFEYQRHQTEPSYLGVLAATGCLMRARRVFPNNCKDFDFLECTTPIRAATISKSSSF